MTQPAVELDAPKSSAEEEEEEQEKEHCDGIDETKSHVSVHLNANSYRTVMFFL